MSFCAGHWVRCRQTKQFRGLKGLMKRWKKTSGLMFSFSSSLSQTVRVCPIIRHRGRPTPHWPERWNGQPRGGQQVLAASAEWPVPVWCTVHRKQRPPLRQHRAAQAASQRLPHQGPLWHSPQREAPGSRHPLPQWHLASDRQLRQLLGEGG